MLAFWLFLIAIHQCIYYLLATGKFHDFPYLLGFEIALPFIHGPFLYSYVALLTGRKIAKLKCFLHFVPAILINLVLSKFFLLSVAEKISVYENQGAGYITILKIIHFAVIPSGVVYTMLSLFLIKEHRSNISDQLSCSEKINLSWVIRLIAGIGVTWLSVLFGNDTSTFMCVHLFILYIGYFGVKQVGIFTNKLAAQTNQIEEINSPVKYQKSAIGKNFCRRYTWIF